MLKIHFVLLFGWLLASATAAQTEKACGYSGNTGKQIEKDLDDCFEKEVKDSRLRMSLGYEKCFGYNYQHLNVTIAEPLDRKQKLANRQLIDLSLKTCVSTDAQEQKIERTKLDKMLNECKHYFNVIIQAMYNDDESVQTYLASQTKLIRPLLGTKKAITSLNSGIIKIVKPIDECKEPESAFRIKLIKKYLEMYLNKVVSPPLPSFNQENVDVFEHPEAYMLLSNKVVRPDIQALLDAKRKKGSFVPEKRVVVMRGRSSSGADDGKTISERKNDIVNKLLGFFKGDKGKGKSSNGDDEDEEEPPKPTVVKVHQDSIEHLVEESAREDGEQEQDSLDELEAQDHDHDRHPIVIDDFFDENLEIKKKKFGRHDFDKYKIKNFDIDRQLKKLFKI